MNSTDLAALKQVCEAATPGPWVAEPGNFIAVPDGRVIAEVPCQGANDKDIDFIATFNPVVVLRLLAVVAEYQAAQAHNLAECERMRTQRTTLERQVARQREVLEKYGKHLDGCGCHGECTGQQTHICNCGLDAILTQEPT